MFTESVSPTFYKLLFAGATRNQKFQEIEGSRSANDDSSLQQATKLGRRDE